MQELCCDCNIMGEGTSLDNLGLDSKLCHMAMIFAYFPVFLMVLLLDIRAFICCTQLEASDRV